MYNFKKTFRATDANSLARKYTNPLVDKKVSSFSNNIDKDTGRENSISFASLQPY